MATLPTKPDAFTQPASEDISNLGVNVAPFAWTTNDITSVKDILTYVQTALQAAESAQANAAVATAAVDRINLLDSQYQVKLQDIDQMYDNMVTLSNNVTVTNADLIQYRDQTKAYRDTTQAMYTEVIGLRDDILTYALQAIYKYFANNNPGASGSLALNVADGTVQFFKLQQPSTTFNIATFTDPVSTCRQITLILQQGTGANQVTWPSKVRWNNNRTPVLSYVKDKVDFITLLTKDSGATWYGFYNGGWFNA
jgi:hypothetical protein